VRPRFKDLRERILTLFRRWDYSVWWKILCTSKYGIPQHRERFYLVAILRPAQKRKFKFPRPFPHEDIGNFLDDCTTTSTLSNQQHNSLDVGLKKLASHNVDPTTSLCVVDVGSSTKWASAMQGRSPCLTARRCEMGGHYITIKNRLMTTDEMCRLQGIPPNRWDWRAAGMKETEFRKCIGNAMSVNLLMHILPRALRAAGLINDIIKPPTNMSICLR